MSCVSKRRTIHQTLTNYEKSHNYVSFIFEYFPFLIAKCCNLVPNWQQMIRFWLQNHSYQCPHLAVDLSTKSADRRLSASRLMVETEQGLLESDSVLNLLSICHQIMHDFARFLPRICWHSMSSKLCRISNSNLLIISDNTNSVHNLLSFCNQKLLADSAQNLSPQALLSGMES